MKQYGNIKSYVTFRKLSENILKGKVSSFNSLVTKRIMKRLIQYPFPIFITKEGGWFVAECPVFNIATQGKTENEVKENIKDLIREYLKDPDTPKSRLKNIRSSSLSYIPVSVSRELL